MEQDKSMVGFGRLSEKGKMEVAPLQESQTYLHRQLLLTIWGFSVMQQHLSINKLVMQELLIYHFSNCCRSVSGEKSNQRWEFSVQAEDFGKSDQVWFLLLQTR
jgi:hypothetical protein